VSATSVAVTVVWATPDVQDVVPLTLPAGSTVMDAVVRSRLVDHYGIDLLAIRFGLHARLVHGDTVLADGDRIELCRPLTADPKAARRARANARGMGTPPRTPKG
jgi:hypothetical protein